MVTRDFLPSPDASIPFPQRMIDTLGRLQAQTHDIVPSNTYVYDLVEQRTLCASRSIATMLGYTAEDIHAMGQTGLADLIHPDDLGRVADHYQRFTTLHYGDVIQIEYRMRRADGSWCWLRSQETTLVQAIDGFPLQILGILQDMTQMTLATTQRSPKRRRVIKAVSNLATRRQQRRLHHVSQPQAAS
ncbi:MAG TPA: PAS domain-containing protein [Crinalium sp.]|jgi:PAS domain S-box-containing protein